VLSTEVEREILHNSCKTNHRLLDKMLQNIEKKTSKQNGLGQNIVAEIRFNKSTTGILEKIKFMKQQYHWQI